MKGLNRPFWHNGFILLQVAYTRDVINMNVEQRGLYSFGEGQNIWICIGTIYKGLIDSC